MTTAMPDPSNRRVLSWARSFSRPMQNEFAPAQSETPEDFSELLEMADKRLNESNKND